MPKFPIFTRSGEVTISIDFVTDEMKFSEEKLSLLWQFHRMLFKYVLRLEKRPMVFVPQNAQSGYIVVPLNTGEHDKWMNILDVFCIMVV